MMKLSLCVITGNAGKYIDRFLDAFQPLADEICIVRAIGNQEPDDTIEKASARGCRTGEYSNTRDWPHVDDFAAARNQAFAMASHEWVMWADLDDVISPESIAAIREGIEAAGPEIEGIVVPYDIRDDGLIHNRERIIRKGAATWESPIHEHLRFHSEEPRIGKIGNAAVVHLPLGPRTVNNERNLRILESISEPTPSHRFHLAMSLRACGRDEDAKEKLAEIVTRHAADFERPELYECLMSLAQMTSERDTRYRLFLQALATDPARREGYGEMVHACIGNGDPRAALGWAEAMKGIREESSPDWNLRRKYFGWAGEQIHAMALRANGRREEADVLQANHFIRSGARISLLHATRGRAGQAVMARLKWLERAADPDAIEHIFGVDSDAPEAHALSLYNSAIVHGNGGPVDAWNACARKSQGEILVQLSDDWDPPLHWDRMILDAFEGADGPVVLAVNDGHRVDDMMCMAILNRARYRQQGYLFHPEFFSMYSDYWFSECAYRDQVVIDRRDSIRFEHLHPMYEKAELDDTYRRTNAPYHYKTGEGILKRLRDGVRVSSDMEGWFDYRDVYDAVAQAIPNGGSFVEVGSWKGKSTAYLADRIADFGKKVSLSAVDTFQGDAETGREDVFDEFSENMAGRDVLAIRKESTEAAKDSGEVWGVFIDAAHDYESVKADITAWLPKVADGGFLGGHDADSPGVAKALADLGIDYETIGRCWIRKP